MTLTGMPTIATIRSSMLPLFPGLIDRLPTVDYAHHRSVREVFRPGEPMRPWSDGRYGLTPAQLTHMLDTPATGSARAAALVFPMVTDRPGRLTMRQVDPATAIEDLRDAIFGIGAWSELGEIFVAPADRQAVTSLDPSRQCRRLVEELPTFECELGREAYEDPSTIEALLEAAF